MCILSALVLLITSVFLYIYWFFKKSHQFFDQYGIPYSKPHWFFGNMKDVILMKKALWVGFKEAYEEFPSERFAGVYNLHRPTVLIRDPDLIKTMLVKDFSHFQDRGFTICRDIEPVAYNLITMSGDDWKNLRIKLTCTFSSGKMKSMFSLMKTCGNDIEPVLTKYFKDDIAFEAKDICARFATDVIGNCAFGIDTHSLLDPESDFRNIGKSIFQYRWQAIIRTIIPSMPIWLIKILKMEFFPRKVNEYFMKLAKDMIEYREKHNISRGDFLDLLIAMKNHKELEKLKDEQDDDDLAKFLAQIGDKFVKNDVEMNIETIAAQCFLFFVGGFDNGSSALAFMLFELAQHPEMQDKVRDEIWSILDTNDGEFTYDMMKKMPYLEMIIAETFRKYPLGAILFRKCTETYKIPQSEAIIKQGTTVVIPVLGLHHDRKYFKTPDNFHPEHFSAEAKQERPQFTYLPFGEGPRMCIAERFARMQIIVGAVHLLKDFVFEVSPQTKLPLEILPNGGGLMVKHGIWLKCRPRLCQSPHEANKTNNLHVQLDTRYLLIRIDIYFESSMKIRYTHIFENIFVTSNLNSLLKMYIPSALVLLLTSAFLYIYWFFKKSHKFFDHHGIPYKKPHWFFGNMKDVVLMKKSLWIGYKEAYENFPTERFAGVYNLHKPKIIIRDPELIRMMLVKDFFYFQDRGVTVSKEIEPVAYNLITMSGDEWRNLRVKLTCTFSSGKMKTMFCLMNACANDIKPALTKYYKDNVAFEAKDICARFTTDVIGSCTFGIDTHSLLDPESDFRNMGKSIFQYRWQAIIRTIIPSMPVWLIKALKMEFFPRKVNDYFMKLAKDMIEYREKNNISRGDFLDLLIAMKNHKELEKLKDEQDDVDLAKFLAQIGDKFVKNDVEMNIETIAAQCFLFFIAGFDNSSSALAFMLFGLALHPQMQEKVRNEIWSILDTNDGEFTYDMMKKMPYLEMIIAETFRKYPLRAILFRKCTQNYKIPESEAVIREGTNIVIPLLGLHHDPKYYKNPDKFDPEHFSAEAKLIRPHFTYLPFGDGPRMCIAERFARMQVFVGAVYLLKDFIFEISSETKTPLEILPTGGGLMVKGGIWMKCRPR
ncbi:uncharacterized protein LOC135843031 [Planococcus citri]|uniref:uncharacterized protein LOC135843031 n=1 Tax=Planococcus citri TaxID=170843 RepID=UPI0031F8FDD2